MEILNIMPIQTFSAVAFCWGIKYESLNSIKEIFFRGKLLGYFQQHFNEVCLLIQF